MSADNFVVIRKKKDGNWWWGDFSDSADYGRVLQDEEFDHGPFPTDNAAIEDIEGVYSGGNILEYGYYIED